MKCAEAIKAFSDKRSDKADQKGGKIFPASFQVNHFLWGKAQEFHHSTYNTNCCGSISHEDE